MASSVSSGDEGEGTSASSGVEGEGTEQPGGPLVTCKPSVNAGSCQHMGLRAKGVVIPLVPMARVLQPLQLLIQSWVVHQADRDDYYDREKALTVEHYEIDW